MLRLILTLLFISILLVNVNCGTHLGTHPSYPFHNIGDLKLYTFTTHQKHILGYAQPFILPPNTSIRDTLDNLGRHLAENYFSKTNTQKLTDIHFEIMRMDEISTPSHKVRIAVVNMVDPDWDAMNSFFQGSAGGMTTFYMLAATFMQAHLNPPLLDGLIILYNGKILSGLDHINLEGILTPRMVQPVVKRVINRTQRQAYMLYFQILLYG